MDFEVTDEAQGAEPITKIERWRISTRQNGGRPKRPNKEKYTTFDRIGPWRGASWQTVKNRLHNCLAPELRVITF